MNISDFQPLSLQDYPGYLATICFTTGCQMRCPFCHNPSLVLPSLYAQPSEKSQAFFSHLQSHPMIDGVVITGGEPLLQSEIVTFLQSLKELNLSIKLDTNGLCPQELDTVLSNHLVDYVALDYKNIGQMFEKTTGLMGLPSERGFDKWLESFHLLRNHTTAYELRTTVVKELHPMTQLQQMAYFLQDQQVEQSWYLQSFQKSDAILADYLPDSESSNLHAYPIDQFNQLEQDLNVIFPLVQLRR